MAEETLRYKVEIDEASLHSELARTRGAISSVLTEAISTGQYSLNSIHNDLSLGRQMIAPMSAPGIASPTQELGFFGSAMAMSGVGAPPNMLTGEWQRQAQREMEQRITGVTAAVSREAVPIATGLLGVGAGMMGGARTVPTLALGGLGYLGGRMFADPVAGELRARQTAEELLAMGGPAFTGAERRGLAAGLAEDISKDVRFGIEDLGSLLAGGMATDMFSGVRSAEDFRARFRTMMDQLRSITRIFQQTTQEAMGTLSQLNSMGMAPPEVMQGRLADMLSMRMGGMDPTSALNMGMAGAQWAAGQGVAAPVGFDAMMRTGMMVQNVGAAQVMSPSLFRQMGGVPGIAGMLMDVNARIPGLPGMRTAIAGLANDAMTQIDQAQLRDFVSGNLDMADVRQRAFDRLSDPAMRARFSSNVDMLENQLATSGLALPMLFRQAEIRAGMVGARPEDVFGAMTAQMGLNPLQRQMALTFGRDYQQFEMVAARQREMGQFTLDLERSNEESRLSSRIGVGLEQARRGLTTYIGEPIRDVGRFLGGVFESIVSFPTRAFEWLDIQMGRAIFGGGDVPVRPVALGAFGDIEGITDLQRQSRYLRGASLPDMAERLSGVSTLRDLRIVSTSEATQNLRDAISGIISDVEPFRDLQGFDRIEDDEMRAAIQEEAIATFADDLHELRMETNPTRRKEMKEKLREKMGGWARIRIGHLADDGQAEVKKFTDQMLEIEQVAQRDDDVRRGLEEAAKSTAVLQVSHFVGEELPILLSQAARDPRAGERLVGVATEISKQFRGRPGVAAFEAIRSLGERALPLLGKGTAIRGRIEVAQELITGGHLRPGDLQVSTKELEAVRELDLSSSQKAYIDQLLKAASQVEGHQLNADAIFRSIGLGLGGGQFPSRTPSPGAELDPYKWDMTGQVLDRLTGAVQNLSVASERLLGKFQLEDKKTAGVA